MGALNYTAFPVLAAALDAALRRPRPPPRTKLRTTSMHAEPGAPRPRCWTRPGGRSLPCSPTRPRSPPCWPATGSPPLPGRALRRGDHTRRPPRVKHPRPARRRPPRHRPGSGLMQQQPPAAPQDRHRRPRARDHRAPPRATPAPRSPPSTARPPPSSPATCRNSVAALAAELVNRAVPHPAAAGQPRLPLPPHGPRRRSPRQCRRKHHVCFRAAADPGRLHRHRRPRRAPASSPPRSTGPGRSPPRSATRQAVTALAQWLPPSSSNSAPTPTLTTLTRAVSSTPAPPSPSSPPRTPAAPRPRALHQRPRHRLDQRP